MKDMWRRLPLKKKIVVLLTLLCIGLTIGYLPEPYPHVLTKEEIKEAESVSRSQTEVLAPNVSLIDQAGHTVSMQSLYISSRTGSSFAAISLQRCSLCTIRSRYSCISG